MEERYDDGLATSLLSDLGASKGMLDRKGVAARSKDGGVSRALTRAELDEARESRGVSVASKETRRKRPAPRVRFHGPIGSEESPRADRRRQPSAGDVTRRLPSFVRVTITDILRSRAWFYVLTVVMVVVTVDRVV